MTSWTRGGVCAFLLLLGLATTPAPASAQSFAWWKNEPFQKEVGLTPDQCTRIDAVFQAALPALRQGKQDLDQQEADLSKLIEANSDEATVVRQVDRVEATRAALNKQRTLMLLHMRQVLTPEQRVRFNTAHDQWERDRRRAQRRDDDNNAQKNPRH